MTYSSFWRRIQRAGGVAVVILKLEDKCTEAKRIVPKLGGNIYSPHLLALQFVITHPTWDNHRSSLVRVITSLLLTTSKLGTVDHVLPTAFVLPYATFRNPPQQNEMFRVTIQLQHRTSSRRLYTPTCLFRLLCFRNSSCTFTLAQIVPNEGGWGYGVK